MIVASIILLTETTHTKLCNIRADIEIELNLQLHQFRKTPTSSA